MFRKALIWTTETPQLWECKTSCGDKAFRYWMKGGGLNSLGHAIVEAHCYERCDNW